MADQDLQRMEEALRSAANAGDNTAATRIAEAIRNRRAMGGQDIPAPAPLPEPEPDPFATVPTEISGVTLSEGIRQQILDGRAIEDPKEKRLAAARIAGRISAQDESGGFLEQVQRGQFGAGLRGFGAGIFGLGDIVAAGGTSIGGEMTFGEALEAQREFRRALEEEFPGTSLTSEVAGAFVGGGAVVKTIGALAKGGGRIPAVIKSVTQLQKGQGVRNVARLSAAGATAGGVTEGVLEGDPASGAFLGLAAGPLGVALTKAGQITKAGITKLLDDPASAGIKALALKMGVKADEMAQRFLEFKTVTGKTPAIADIANNEAAAELRQMIANVPAAAVVAREGAERVTATRGGEVAEQLVGGGERTTAAAIKAERTKVAEQMFAKADQDIIKFSRADAQDLLNDPDLRSGIPRSLRRRLDEIMDAAGEGKPVELSGLDVNDMRIALRKRGRGATGADQVFNELADEVENIARKQSPAFAEAIDEFARRSFQAEGVTAGRKVAGQATSEFEQVVKGAPTPEFRAGVREGVRAEIGDVAQESAAKADRLVKSLSEEGGLTQRLRSILPAREVDQIQNVAKLQSRSAANIRTLAPGVRAEAGGTIEAAVDDAVGAIVASTGGAGAGFKSNVAVRVIKRFLPGGNPKVIENLARDLFDPSKTQQVITALRRAQVDERDILDLYTQVAVSSGAGAAATTN